MTRPLLNLVNSPASVERRTRIWNFLIRWAFRLLVFVLVMMAVYVSLGRYFLPRLDQFHPWLEQQLSQSLKAEVRFDSVQGEWSGFAPVLAMDGIRIGSRDSDIQLDHVESLRAHLDIINSIRYRQLVFSTFKLAGVDFQIYETVVKGWQWHGSNEKNTSVIRLVRQLVNQRHIKLERISVSFIALDGQQRQLLLDHLQMYCNPDFCSSEGSLVAEAEQTSQFDFRLNLFGEPGTDQFILDGYAQLQPIDLIPWITVTGFTIPEAANLNQLEVGGELWLTWGDNELLELRGSVQLPSIQLEPVQNDPVRLDNLASNFVWQRFTGNPDEKWAVWLDDFSFNWGGRQFGPAQQRWALEQRDGKNWIRVVADTIDLDFTRESLISIQSLPDKLKTVLQTLNPRGRLENAHIDYQLQRNEEQTLPGFEIEAELVDVAVDPWNNAPAATGLYGYVKANAEGGEVDFDSNGLWVQFPRLYSQGWTFDSAQGRVYWQLNEGQVWVNSDPIQLNSAAGDATGQFELDWSREGVEPRLDMAIHLEQGMLLNALEFTPDQRLPATLIDWLDDSILDGEVVEADFIYSGSVRKGSGAIAHSILLNVEANHLKLKLPNGWPQLQDAHVMVEVNDGQARISADSATLAEFRVDQLSGLVDTETEQPHVLIRSQLQGSADKALSFLQTSPIRQDWFDELNDFEASGEVGLDLQLDIPLKSSTENLGSTQVDLNIEATDVNLRIVSQDLDFTGINGPVQFATEKGFSADQVRFQWLNQPYDLSITSEQDQTGSRVTRLQAKGLVTAQDLTAWKPLPADQRINGNAQLNAELVVGDKVTNRLSLQSDLAGMAIDLPFPLGKLESERKPFSLTIPLEGRTWHSFSYDRLVNANLLMQNGRYTDGEVTLGGTPARQTIGQGIRVLGSIAFVDVAQWFDLMGSLTEGQGSSTRDITFSGLQLDVGLMRIMGQQLEAPVLNIEQDDGKWMIALEHPDFNGRLHYQPGSDTPLYVVFNRLNIKTTAKDKSLDPLADMHPQDLPASRVVIEQLSLNGDDFGKWQFLLKPNKDGLKAENINLDVKSMQIQGELDWIALDNRQLTRFTGKAESVQVSDVLTAWGMTPSMEGQNLNLDGRVIWNGSPAAFDVMKLDGEISMKIGQGRLLDIESASGALRLFAVGNFSALLRRMRLDFSDLFQKGYSFDTMTGSFQLNQGELTLQDSLIVDGPSAKFKVDGKTDLQHRQYDQEVLVVLPLADNIPMAAAIIGAPQVGIPLWLLNKAFGNMFDEFTSIRYKVTGSWDDPVIETVTGSRVRSASPTEIPQETGTQ